MQPLDIEKTAIGFIEDAGKTVKEIVSIGVASDDVTVVVFIDDEGEKLLAEISDTGTEIFEFQG